ncbi:hypothetical protein L596_013932 [Steinernema carpocapsae]|uniref:Uncharacterized protein n=1 Tax=Steinernema carpocapsae TaxID=34508 RepID=A0A4U5P315_STECR|nr:hypothetical protein L596_013932 [Steinernema carpocapsae]
MSVFCSPKFANEQEERIKHVKPKQTSSFFVFACVLTIAAAPLSFHLMVQDFGTGPGADCAERSPVVGTSPTSALEEIKCSWRRLQGSGAERQTHEKKRRAATSLAERRIRIHM